jgi:CBS domain-containing protein
MKASDIMSPRVISIAPNASILEAIRVMLQKHISGLPVIDPSGALVGIVTEGDFLRRAETGTARSRPRWLEFLMGPDRMANEYVRAHARKVEDVMTREPITVTEDTPLDEVVRLMERKRVKRLPVVRGTEVIGIVSRAAAAPMAQSDVAIRQQLLAEFDKQTWAPVALIDAVVKDGAVELWGTIMEASQGEALRVLAENIPGVTSVASHLTWIEPMTGMVIEAPEDTKPKAASWG